MHTPRHGGRQGPNKPGKDRVLPRLIDSIQYVDNIQAVRRIENGARNRRYSGPEGAPLPSTEYTVSKFSTSLAIAAGNVASDIISGSGGLFR